MAFDFNTALLIHFGAVFYIVAFLIRDEMKLRLMVLAGSAFYLLYYYLFPDIPLWDAIFTTFILVAANLVILFRIAMERTVFALSAEDKKLFESFDGFSPGQFRQLLKIARWSTAETLLPLASENQPLTNLYFLIDGAVVIKKGDKTFQLEPDNFIGEIAFVLDRAPSADVTALPGARLVHWEAAQVTKLMKKSPAFQNAIMALLSRDLAEKLAKSVQVEQLMDTVPAV
ncbi:MAG: cyclic nucleotide-binding domain-containing protein [Parasphingorhabdus sp.]|uniref:Crp/Fnr family transcriptional regulator n=1 Tax=Parasphingorhabdus sp. TaxID=2709688 RepID=UPI003296F5F8